MVDVETILASLYAKEISASLEWKSDRGFYPGFGYPAMREKWFRTSGEAVGWLKEQALVKYPSIEFPPERNRIDAEAILNDLSASQIDGSIEWIWDGDFLVSLGGQMKAERWSLETVADVVEWLREEACRRYPESEFARKYRASSQSSSGAKQATASEATDATPGRSRRSAASSAKSC